MIYDAPAHIACEALSFEGRTDPYGGLRKNGGYTNTRRPTANTKTFTLTFCIRKVYGRRPPISPTRSVPYTRTD